MTLFTKVIENLILNLTIHISLGTKHIWLKTLACNTENAEINLFIIDCFLFTNAIRYLCAINV